MLFLPRLQQRTVLRTESGRSTTRSVQRRKHSKTLFSVTLLSEGDKAYCALCDTVYFVLGWSAMAARGSITLNVKLSVI